MYHKNLHFVKFQYIFRNMKPVMEYQDYRRYLQDVYSARKERSAFSWREFARLAGYASPVYLKLVCEGKSSLSEIGVERVANAVGLSGSELCYFRALVRFNQAKDAGEKKSAFEDMRSIAKANKVNVVGEDQYDYFNSWRNPVLRELAPLAPGASAAELAARMLPKTSASEVKDALRLLLSTGMLVQNADGTYREAEKSVTTGNMEVASLAVRSMHREMGKLAVAALDGVPPAERDISGITLGLTESAFDKIANELSEFRRRVVAIATEDAGADRVYRLNLQLFPLTAKKQEASK